MNLRRFVDWQVRVCKRIDARMFPMFSIDGNREFVKCVSEIVADDSDLADVGGGKTPFFSAPEVLAKRLRVTGIDIDPTELARAPSGAYASIKVSAIENVDGPARSDFVIAQSVLEHVRDGRRAALGIGALAKSGGTVVTFCPCRRAWFAKLNLILPERLKRAVLFSVFPQKRERQGFPAYYDGCSPGELTANMAEAGIQAREVRHYFVSSYFMFFVPLFLVWRLTTYPLMRFWPNRYCETFIFIGKKI